MGFEVPEPYVWDESFRVFYDTLDNEHKNLFKCLFDCTNSPGDGKCLQSLLTTATNHFKTEEAMFSKSSYADAASHKAIHDGFLADAGGLSTPLPADKIAWAKDWLVNHIKGTDHKYIGKLG
uniref:Hemerythrin n=2 Tax=Polychaeta TaxID=6341 RepID=A0A1S6QD52_9ANNE|nr:hemerythrin [Sternaspis scutata]